MRKLIVPSFFAMTSAHVIAAPSATPLAASGAINDFPKVIIALVFIVGLIFACAWLMRRMSGGAGLNQKHIQVMSVMPLGTREKLMIIRAADDYLLIGVTPNGINTLHRFDEPIDLASPMATSPFADRLKGLLKGIESDPLAKHRNPSQGSEKNS